ncbi:hypothetical protein RGL54_004924 [Vibrio parahaemolyticus]|nr:hypothetical protein [Vibrio parahaemolyticus]
MLENNKDSYLVLATLDGKKLVVIDALLEFESIYRVVFGPATLDECNTFVDDFVSQRPERLSHYP